MEDNFYHKLVNLLKEPAFKRLKRSYTNYSIFTFSNLKESHTTELIGWLLNPREAHGSHIFFDTFLAAVLQALEESEIKNKPELLKQVAKLQKSKKTRKSYIFETEYGMNGKDRCDVVGISLNGNMPIFIENKVGSDLSGDQLEKYMDYADTNTHEGLPLLIFMDASSERTLLERAPDLVRQRWLPVSYDWIGEAIEEYLSAPASPAVTVILKSFQTELESYMSTDLNQKNIYWAEAYKDIETLAREYHSLFQDKEYKKFSELRPHEYANSASKYDKTLAARFKYSEIFSDLEDFGVFDIFEWSENVNPGFKYETHIARKYAYFYPGGLEKIDDDWPVNIRLYERSLLTEDGVETEETVYDLSLTLIAKKYGDDYSQAIRDYFTKSKTAKFLTKNLKHHEIRDCLFKGLEDLRVEIELFNQTLE